MNSPEPTTHVFRKAGLNGTVVDTLRLGLRRQRLNQAAILETRPGIRIVDLPTTQVRVRIAGTGSKTLVFTCDPPNVVEQYDEIIERLGKNHRIVVMELPGAGFSFPKSDFGFTLPNYVDALKALLVELDMAPYVLVSPCVSTYTALFAAAENPDLIERVVLMQATGWAQEVYWTRELAKLLTPLMMGIPVFGDKVWGAPYLGQALSALTERWFPHMTTGPSVYRAKKRPDFAEKFMTPHKAAFAHGACNCQVSLYQRYFIGDDANFPRIKQPALVLWGNCDISHDNRSLRSRKGLPGLLARTLGEPVQSDKRGLLKYAPHASFKEIEKTGHFLELESPAEVCKVIAEFLAS